MNAFILVAAGGAIGSMLRYGASVIFGARPITTFAVNITGSFLIGLLAVMASDEKIRLLLGAGFLGGFTTFSAWQLEALIAARSDPSYRSAAWILGGSLAAGFLACTAGFALAQRFKF